MSHVVLRDAGGRLVELHAEPAQNGRRVRQLVRLDQLKHARVAANSFLLLLVAVVNARCGHVNLPLLAPNTSGSHWRFLSLSKFARVEKGKDSGSCRYWQRGAVYRGCRR